MPDQWGIPEKKCPMAGGDGVIIFRNSPSEAQLALWGNITW
jgi:hypothetical protein